MSNTTLIIVISIVVITLIFNYVNGFHDTANSIATSIATRSLRPSHAIIMASILELLGALFSTKVAETVGTGIIKSNIINYSILFSAILAAIIWNLITWYYSIPSSSSHALIGGLVGAALLNTFSINSVYWLNLLLKVILPLFLAPIFGFLAGGLFIIIILWILKPFKPRTINSLFLKLQILSSGLVALSHGANDAQKAMGIIGLTLVISHPGSAFVVPLWVQLTCALALALGTATGGWKIIKAMGNNICKLRPVTGFAAQTATAAVINSATFFIGAPVSTTHIISTAIMGVGATHRISSVKWKVARNLLYTWLITIPTSALIAGLIQEIIKMF